MDGEVKDVTSHDRRESRHQVRGQRVLQHVTESHRGPRGFDKSGSSCTVRNMTPAEKPSSFRHKAASIPFTTGMEMSKTRDIGGQYSCKLDRALAVLGSANDVELVSKD